MLGKIAMTLFGGTTLGATLMYLLDPDQGEKHRKTIRRSAASTYDTARQSAAAGVESAKPLIASWRTRLSNHLATASQALAPESRPLGLTPEEHLDLTPSQSYTALALARHSRELHGEARESYARARDYYYHALVDLDLARHRYQRLAPKPKVKLVRPKLIVNRPEPDYLTIGLVAAGCCAVGAAAMFILDPTSGRRRRALARDKASSTTHRTARAVGDSLTRTTRHIRGRAQGQVARAKSAFRHDAASDAQLVARIRTQLGRALPGATHLQITAAAGTVTLAGTFPGSDFDTVMKTVYATPGVREVISQIEPRLATT